MSSLPRTESAVNGAFDGVHTQHLDDAPPIMGSSAGAAEREAQATAETIILRLLASENPRVELLELFDQAAYEIGKLVAHGLLDRTVWADLLRKAAIKLELVLQYGEDAVQTLMAGAFAHAEEAAVEECEEDEERDKSDLDRMNELLRRGAGRRQNARHGVSGIAGPARRSHSGLFDLPRLPGLPRQVACAGRGRRRDGELWPRHLVAEASPAATV
jgi:hypothetical protein